MEKTDFATLTLPDIPDHAAYLRSDGPGCYRWYDDAGMDTETSGHSIADAIRTARAAWPDATIRVHK